MYQQTINLYGAPVPRRDYLTIQGLADYLLADRTPGSTTPELRREAAALAAKMYERWAQVQREVQRPRLAVV